MSLKETRIDYNKGSLDDQSKNQTPQDIFNAWLETARVNEITDYNAMIISTISNDGFPASRIVLLREVTDEGLVFYTNYHSDKGEEIKGNNKVSVNFFWKELERQVRIQGLAVKVPASKSDEYFKSRPRKSQIGAWVSDQSSVIDSRQFLLDKEKELTKKFENKEVPRPKDWGGYVILPTEYEFWQGRSGRLHDRLKFKDSSKGWNVDRLAP